MWFYCKIQVIRIIDIIPPPPTAEEFDDVYIVQVTIILIIIGTSKLIQKYSHSIINAVLLYFVGPDGN